MKRALVVSVGGFRGAYDAGALRVFGGTLEASFFDSIYASSAGVVSATYFATEQSKELKKLWIEQVTLGRLFGLVSNPMHGRPILDLDYLVQCMREGQHALRSRHIGGAKLPRLTYALTDHATGKPVYLSPTPDTVFTLMKAALSVPYLFPPVTVEDSTLVDGGLADPLPIQKAFDEGHDEVWVVYNKPCQFFTSKKFQACSGFIAAGLPPQLGAHVKTLNARFQEYDDLLTNDPRIKTIRPKSNLPSLHIFDDSLQRMTLAYEAGVADATRFLKSYQPGLVPVIQ